MKSLFENRLFFFVNICVYDIILLIYMKKLVLVLVSIIILSFILISYMVNNNDKYIANLEKMIIDNTDIKLVNYVNKYGEYYIVSDKDNLYLVNMEYDIIFDIEKSKIHENSKNYDIIYKEDKLMYFNNIYDKDRLVYEYYDLYTYEIIDKVVVGDNYG